MTWPMVPLGEVVNFYSGATPTRTVPEFWNGQTPWFSAKDVKRRRLADSIDHVSAEAFERTSLRRIPPNTVVMVVRGMILAHTVPIAVLEVESAINQDLKALIPKQDIDPHFLLAMLVASHGSILERVTTAAHGTTKLDARVLESISIPVPPLDEQLRLAALLDHANGLGARARAAEQYASTTSAALYRATFETGDVVGTRPLSDVATIGSGITKGRTLGGAPTTSVPYLAVSNVQDGHLRMNVVKQIDVTADEILRFALRDGDLVLTEGGDPDKLGRGTVWRSELPLCLHQNHVFRVRPSDEVLPDYLSAFIAGRAARNYFRRAAKQTTGIATINKTQLGALPVVVPPIVKQQEFVRRLQRLSAHTALLARRRTQVEVLISSLQARAFAGEL